MKASKKLTGFALASAAALMLAGCGGKDVAAPEDSATEQTQTAPAAPEQAAPAQEATVKCTGVNACKGQSACATATSSCKGHNACKGQGWVETSATDCDAKGGKAG